MKQEKQMPRRVYQAPRMETYQLKRYNLLHEASLRGGLDDFDPIDEDGWDLESEQ